MGHDVKRYLQNIQQFLFSLKHLSGERKISFLQRLKVNVIYQQSVFIAEHEQYC